MKRDKPPQSTNYYPGLDVVRFVAACLVMLFHLGTRGWADGRFPEVEPFAGLGWVGVEIFFVLSGFVIAASAGGASPFAFARSRVLRLLPAIWICASLSLAVALLRHGSAGELALRWIRSAIIWPRGPWIDIPYWSLPIETAFYAGIFGLLCLDRFRSIEPVAIATGALSSLFWIGVTIAPGLQFLTSSWLLGELLVRHGCFFALGIGIWLVLTRGASVARWLLIGVTALGGIVEIYAHARETHIPLQGDIAAALVWVMAVAAIFLSGRASAQPRRWIRLVGLMTYPLYLVHYLVGGYVEATASTLGVSRFGSLALAVGASLLIAWAVVTGPEPLLRSLLSRGLTPLTQWLGRARLGRTLLAPTTAL